MWDQIVSVPDHCLSFYLETNKSTILSHSKLMEETVILNDQHNF